MPLVDPTKLVTLPQHWQAGLQTNEPLCICFGFKRSELYGLESRMYSYELVTCPNCLVAADWCHEHQVPLAKPLSDTRFNGLSFTTMFDGVLLANRRGVPMICVGQSRLMRAVDPPQEVRSIVR